MSVKSCGRILFFTLSVFLLFFAEACASDVGETVPIEGFVDSAGRNSLYVSGKILVADEYSSISTAGSNIYPGDYVMGFIYLNEDRQSYTIVSLAKLPEKSIGTPTPLPSSTPTPVWADLFTATPDPSFKDNSGLQLLSENTATGTDELFPVSETDETPSPTPSSISFEGEISSVSGGRIVIDGKEYVTDNSTGYKGGRNVLSEGDYVQGRAAPYLGIPIIRYVEVIPDYDRPGLEQRTVLGLYQSQDSSKIIISAPEGEIEGLFYPGTKMSKTFYTKGTPLRLEMAGSYVKSAADFPLFQSGPEISPINGTVDEIIRFSEKEVYIVSSNTTFSLDADTGFIPDIKCLEKGALFAGLVRNGKIKLLYFTENNRVKTVNGSAASVIRDEDGIRVLVGGVEYKITPDSVVMGSNLVRHSEILGYADSVNNIFYMSFKTPWYSGIKDWNWTVIIPSAVSGLALLFFLLLHRTRTEGFLQEVNGNILTLTDARGEHKRHFTCTDEIAGYVSSLVTMKVELTVYHGRVIHIRYDF